MYKYQFVSACFEIDAIMDDMDIRNSLKTNCCPHITVCSRYSLLSKAIHVGFYSCQLATTTLDATLLLYAVFMPTDLNSM